MVSDPRKKRLELLSITGGADEFDIFVKSVIGADSEWDINFQTTIKYLVPRYNHYANREGQPLIPIRHSYLESDWSETQRLYELLPMQYIEMVVINFDLLYPTQNEQQFIGRFEASMIKPFYPELVVMYETYKGSYLEIVQKCIDMLVPDQTRLKQEFRNDVEVFSPNLVRQFPHFNVDKAEFLKMLYAGVVERGTFPWATRDSDLALMQELGSSYDIQLLTSIAGGDFGLTLQLIATGLYYLYFLIMKMFPHYAALKFDVITLFTEALMEMVVNFNPQLLLQHRVDTAHLNSVLTFVRSLQSGYVNPYDENMGLPDVPNFGPQEELDKALINFTKIPPIPTFLPKIVRPKNVDDDDDEKGGGRPPVAPAVIPSMEDFNDFNDAIIEGGDGSEGEGE